MMAPIATPISTSTAEVNFGAFENLPKLHVSKNDLQALPVSKRVGFIAKQFFNNEESSSKVALVNNLVGIGTNILEACFPHPVTKMYTQAIRRCVQALCVLPVISEVVSVDDDSGDTFSEAYEIVGRVLLHNFGFSDFNHMNHSGMREKLIYDYVLKAKTELGITHSESRDTADGVRIAVGKFGNINFAVMVSQTPFLLSTGASYTTMVFTEVRTDLDSIYDKLSSASLEAFVREVDPVHNFIECSENGFTASPRPVEINAVIHNMPYAEILMFANHGVTTRKRTSIMVVGNAGLGKSLMLHKLMADMPGVPFVWLRPGHIEVGTDYVYSVIRAIGPCVLVLDDFDCCDVSEKTSYLTSDLLRRFDDHGNLQAVLISTVNDPKLVNYALKRPGRLGDHIFLAEYPCVESARDVLAYRKSCSEWPEEFCEHICASVVAAKMTFAGITVVIADIELAILNGAGFTLEIVDRVIAASVRSRELSRMESDDGELVEVGSARTSMDPNVDSRIARYRARKGFKRCAQEVTPASVRAVSRFRLELDTDRKARQRKYGKTKGDEDFGMPVTTECSGRGHR